MKPQVTRTQLVVAAALTLGALAGCASGPPVGWGGADEVLFSSTDVIKIQWDNLITNEEAVRQKASAHCGGGRVEVIDASSDTRTFGLVRSKTWRCAR